MKALYFDGNRLALRDTPVPNLETGEALVRIRYAGICNTDLEILKGYMGFTGVLGHEFVGIVEEAPYTDLIGKTVVGEINIPCGRCEFCQKGLKNHCPNRKVLGILHKDGVMAEYTSMPIQNLHVVPPNVPELEAVFTEPLAAACEILEQIDIMPDYRILVLGDGKLGQLVAQVLRLHSDNVWVVGKSPYKLKLLEQFKIHTLLKEQMDFPPQHFHVVVEVTGDWSGLEMALTYVRPRGFLVMKSTYAGDHPFNPARLVINEIVLVGSRCGPFPRALSMLERGEVLVEPLLSGIFPLEQYEKAFQRSQEKDVLKIVLQISGEPGE